MKSVGRREFQNSKRERKFFRFLDQSHVFQAISRGFPTSSSNVFQRLPTSSICLETICGDGITKPYICAWRHPSSNSQCRNATHKTIQIQRSSCDVSFLFCCFGGALWGGRPTRASFGEESSIRSALRGRGCDPDVAGVASRGKPESDYPAHWLVDKVLHISQGHQIFMCMYEQINARRAWLVGCLLPASSAASAMLL